MPADTPPQDHREAEIEAEKADKPKQWHGVCAAKGSTEPFYTRLGGVLQAGEDEDDTRTNRQLAASPHPHVYMEELEESSDTDSQPNQMRRAKMASAKTWMD